MLKKFKIALATTAMVGAAGVAHAMTPKTVVDIAAGNENFQTLVAAVTAADLVETLSAEGPFTVFAPTDDAFAALPEGTLEDLLKPENKDQLISILTYHVIPGAVESGDIAGKEMAVASVQGDMIDIDATDGVMVDGATVVTADLVAGNGVVHVIDKVIMPGS